MATLARFVLVPLAATLGACATSYAPHSVWNDGGYSEQPREPGVYQVWFVGNERTLPEKSEDFVLLRAADLCLGASLPFMHVRNFTSGPIDLRYKAAQVHSRRSRIAGVGSDNTPYYPTDIVSVRPGRLVFRTRSGLEVSCLAGAGEETRDAAEIAAAIRQRYDIAIDATR
jgi:hypothetical protein